MSLTPGTKLGPYEILSPLGAGGMGEVYRARDTRLRRDVAVKVLPPEFASDPERLHRFEQEARAAAALNHPNIVVLYDLGFHEGEPYLVTELLEGETLRKRIHDAALPVPKVVDFGAQVAHGLAAAHEKGIIHRDLKPENLFVTKDGRVKILDFGLARLRPGGDGTGDLSQSPTADTPTREGKVMGTVGYMAPEQVRGKPTDARSDVFALGCVLYEMASGKQAFMRETAAETMTAILREEPPELSGTGKPVPPGLERIVRRCLEKSPEERFQSASDLAFSLVAISSLTGTGAVPAPPGVRGRHGSWAFRPWVVIGTICAALVLGISAGVILYRATNLPFDLVFRQLTFRRGEMWGARFSPDGKEVFYSASWDGKPPDTFSVRPGSPESRSLGFGSSDLRGVFPNGDLLIRNKDGALAVAPVNGGAPRTILEDFRWVDVGPDPQHICVVRKETDVNRIEYPIGKLIYRTPSPVSVPRLSHRGDRIAFASGNSIWVVDMAGKANCLVKYEGELWSALCWAPSDDEVWFTGRKDGAGWGLYAVTMGGRLRRIYGGPGRLCLMDIATDGRVLLMRGSCRYGIVVGDTKTGEERELSWLDGSNLGPLSKDGSRILFHEGMEAVSGKPVLYMRSTDGSPPVKLGEGYPADFSPDGQWVLAIMPGEKGAQIQAIPTGAGQPKVLTNDGLNHQSVRCMPDGKSFAFLGNEPGKRPRFWIQSLEGGAPKPLTAEGDYDRIIAVSPDGRDLAGFDKEEGEAFLFSTDGGKPRWLPGEYVTLPPLAFSSDGKALYVGWRKIFRVDIKTGQRTIVREIKPADPAGFRLESGSTITPDGKTYAYGYYRELAELFVAEGLK